MSTQTVAQNKHLVIRETTKQSKLAKSALRGSVLPVVVLIAWQALGSVGILPAQLFSSPLLIVMTFIDLVQSGEMGMHLQISLTRAFLGFALGGFLGLLLGVIVGMQKKSEEYLNPSIQMLRTVPLLAITPLFIMWFGFGELSKVLLIALGAFFPLYLQTFLGLRNVDKKLYDVALILEFSRREQITKLMIPAALPNILLGIRLALSAAWMCLVVAELLGADRGVGFMIQDARSFMQTDVVFVGIIIFALAGKISDSLVRFLENHLLKWQDSFKA
ncbi:ABC transporter permease [Peribacillus frigoritolerans]|nr:ABC transporter permease [Peribacillus frigoritolerans]AZV61260.1 ABC transporter permease [Peribacillus frigoritolerans]MDM5310813.1 ABC transporter permease [Peribacillus frigoritolerans]UZD47691.1 ABC transporter permease [Peribacillus frigoritolerans]WHX62801.1 ABC transporter permease [Peribacillus frigoritolerans]